MLGKLLKYETKATGRIFLPLFGVLLVFALINRLFSNIGMNGIWSIPYGVSMAAYVVLIVAIFVFTFVIMIQRFYKNLLSDEGYLMYTLPVKPWKHIITKMLISMLWIILSMVVTFLSIMIIVYSSGMWTQFLHGWNMMIQEMTYDLGFSPIAFFFESMVLFLLSIADSVLMIYASISLGHLSNRHKFLASFGAFLGLNIIVQIITSTFGYIASHTGIFDWMTYAEPSTVAHFTLNGLSLMVILEGAVFFLIVRYITTKKLNLE